MTSGQPSLRRRTALVTLSRTNRDVRRSGIWHEVPRRQPQLPRVGGRPVTCLGRYCLSADDEDP
jgi:hypothetical protein